MSLADDLTIAFEELELTVPVQMYRTGAVTRALFDASVELLTADINVETSTAALHVRRGALGNVQIDDQIRVGQLGAVAVTGADPLYAYRGPLSMRDDGAIDHLAIVEV